MSLLTTTFYARYIDRHPDPGLCEILSIDWERKVVDMTNHACRYFPHFDEIKIVEATSPDIEPRRQGIRKPPPLRP